MGPKRAQSLPPRLNLRSRKVRDCCISKTWRPIKDFASAKNQLRCKLAMDQVAIAAGLPLGIRLEPDLDGVWISLYDSTVGSEMPPSPEIFPSVEQSCKPIETNITDGSIGTQAEDSSRASSNSAEDFVENTKNSGCSPPSSVQCSLSCHHCLAARAKEPRHVVLERAARERPFKGKPSSMPRLLAGYGRNDYQLGGKSAISRIVVGESRCEYCKTKKKKCIIVDRDAFWKRSQCVACVQRKGKCSLETAIRKTEPPKR